MNEVVKWNITDTLTVDVILVAVDGDRAKIRRDGRKLTVRTGELDLKEVTTDVA